MSGWDGNWAAESNWNKCSAFKHVQSRCGEHSHTRGSKGFLYENKLKIICDLLTCTLQRGRSGLRWVDLQPERARSLLHTPHPLQQWTGREKKKHLRKTLHVFSIALLYYYYSNHSSSLSNIKAHWRETKPPGWGNQALLQETGSETSNVLMHENMHPLMFFS